MRRTPGRQIEPGRHHQRRPLAIFDATVFHVGAANAGHDTVDELLFEGLVVLVIVRGTGGASGHHEANAEYGDGELRPRQGVRNGFCTFQPPALVSRITLFPFKILRRGASI